MLTEADLILCAADSSEVGDHGSNLADPVCRVGYVYIYRMRRRIYQGGKIGSISTAIVG